MVLNSFQTPQKKSFFPIILIVSVVVLLAGGGYWYFKLRENSIPSDTTSNDPPSSSVATANIISAEDQIKVEEITKAVATLKTLSLDIKFFEDSRFTSLKETEIIILDLSPNNKHPFQFIGSETSVPVSAASSSSKKK